MEYTGVKEAAEKCGFIPRVLIYHCVNRRKHASKNAIKEE